MQTTPQEWELTCQDPEDGSGDSIVEIPPDLLESIGWKQGDTLTVEASEESIILKLKQQA